MVLFFILDVYILLGSATLPIRSNNKNKKESYEKNYNYNYASDA